MRIGTNAIAGMRLAIAASAAAMLMLGAGMLAPRAAEDAFVLPPPVVDAAKPSQPGMQKIVLAGGCFWGVQAVFQHVKGVTRAVSGYSGGNRETAHYDAVSSGRTGHAESVEVEFDPGEVSLGKILQIFLSVAHNPTELDRQGPDIGPQYRSAIFFAGDEQRSVAQAYIAQLGKAGAFPRPIVTRLDRFTAFYPAESYHQDYATRHPENPYILYNDLPKIENLKRMFPESYREHPVLVLADRTP